MFLREAPNSTLKDLAASVGEPGSTVATTGTRIKVVVPSGSDAEGDDGDGPLITLETPRGKKMEVPFNDAGAEALCSFIDVPRPFVRRLMKNGAGDVAIDLMNTLLERNPQTVNARIDKERGLMWMRDPGQKIIEPHAVVEVASRVLGETAPVVEHFLSTGEFWFDAFCFDRDFGDTSKKVGDVTKAGLRFAQNLHQNLAPEVAPYMYRLICTNGMQTRDDGLKIDARGSTVEEILADLESMAQRAFARVEKDVAHFYELRDVPADQPERAIARMASEFGLSDRMRLRLIDRVPTVLGSDGSASMFDLVNLVTNTANDPEVAGRRGNRLAFERFGGVAVDDHAARCGHCRAKLN